VKPTTQRPKPDLTIGIRIFESDIIASYMYVLSYLVCFAKKKPLGTSISVFIFIYQL
jgi:hypothetical protein